MSDGFGLRDAGLVGLGSLAQPIVQGIKGRTEVFRDPTRVEKQQLKQAIRNYERAEKFYKDASAEERKDLQKTLDSFKNEAVKSMENLGSAMDKAKLTGTDTFWGRLGVGTRGMLEETGIVNLLSVRGGFGVTAGIFAAIAQNLQAISALSEQTGMFAESIAKEYRVMARTSADMVQSEEKLYSTVSNRFNIMISLRRQMGDILSVSNRTLDTLANFPNVIGLSNDESIAFLTTLRSINGQSIEFNTNLIKSLAILGDRNAVAFRDIMDDVQNNADLFATYSGVASENLNKTMIYARRIGLDLGTIAGILEGFVGIESSIESQARLTALIGRNFDFLSISAKMFYGDTLGATQTLLDQLRGISEEQFNMPFVRRQLSQELGVSVQEINRLYRAARNFRDDDILLDMRISEGLEEFNERFNQLGFGRIRQAFFVNVLSPLSNLLSENFEQVQNFISMIEVVVNYFGKFVSGMIRFGLNLVDGITKMDNWMSRMFGRDGFLGRGGTIAVALGSIVSATGFLLGLANRSYVLDIERNTLLRGMLSQAQFQAVHDKMQPSKITPWAVRGGSFLLGGSLGVAQATSLISGRGREFSGTELLSNMAMGAGAGALMSGPFAKIGAGIGALVGGVGYLVSTAGSSEATRIESPVRKEVSKPRTSGFVPPQSEVNIHKNSIESLGKEIAKNIINGDPTLNITMDSTNPLARDVSARLT